ncbi:acyl-CoA-binding domain-containing protein 5-like [Argentina anserina]|uniref:acyl-CoA-binding domain-containing protein 5-like n=1 Tax=Argentina anserina TaxID=57926 RepID=UPI0021765FB7|nr:acyl-CoA-binding domain-containing protein 5-like [Potentilla anserina]XP_050368818.1 acyl-CoA-binding domain-containing protein 5-like [Potentilla anserina]
MDFISDFVLTIALCSLVPLFLCFLLPVIVALCPSRDDHVGKRRVLYECEPSVHEWESEVGSGFVEKAAEVDGFKGEPKKESLVLDEFGDEGLAENEVLRGVGDGCVKEKSVEEERFDGLCECVENVFDESVERCEFGGVEFGLGERNVDEEGCDGHGGIKNLFDESCGRLEFGLGRNEVGVVCLGEKNVEEEGIDGRVGVCGYVENFESFEKIENGGLELDLGKDQVGVVALNEKNVEQESHEGDGGVCGCGENLVDTSLERHEFSEVESGLERNEVGVVCLPEKYVEEGCPLGDVGIRGSRENLVNESSERHAFGEIEFGSERNQVAILESEEIKLSNCEDDDDDDETDEAKHNVVDGEADEGLFGEDNDWENIKRTELERLFGSAVVFVGSKSNADRVSSLGSDVKMRLDGLHTIATRGPCLEPQPMAFKVSARAKWNAWWQLGNMSSEVAMEQYITLLSESVPGWMQDVHGDFLDPQVYKTITADPNTVMPNKSEAAGVRIVEELKPDAKGFNEIGLGVITH